MEKIIGALVVLYNPDYDNFISALKALEPQVDGVCIVDNSIISHSSWFDGNPKVLYVSMGKNVGIAAAQNVGISKLHEAGYRYVLFSDQDSIAFPDLVDRLYTAHRQLSLAGIAVATVGCQAIDTATGYRYDSRNVKTIREFTLGERRYVHVDYVQSSMSLTSMETLRLVGGMDEALFIDGVDSEWCWRAFSKQGLKTLLVPDAAIYHTLGHGGHMVFHKFVTIPASFRMFYQYRNYFWLLRRNYVPLRWKIRNCIKYIVKVPYYSLLCKPRVENLKCIFHGAYSGIFTIPKS